MVVVPYQVGFSFKPDRTLTKLHLTCWQCATVSWNCLGWNRAQDQPLTQHWQAQH